METPTSVTIGFKDRLSAFRIPTFSKNSARVELRFPDVSCQIYLTLCAVLMSAFEKMFVKKQTKYEKLSLLPTSLNSSLNYLKQDDLLIKLVPKIYFDEVQTNLFEYSKQITPWELKNYL